MIDHTHTHRIIRVRRAIRSSRLNGFDWIQAWEAAFGDTVGKTDREGFKQSASANGIDFCLQLFTNSLDLSSNEHTVCRTEMCAGRKERLAL